MKKFTTLIILNLSLLESSVVMASEFCDQDYKLRCLVDSPVQANLVCTFAGRCSEEELARLPSLRHKTVTLLTQRQMKQLK